MTVYRRPDPIPRPAPERRAGAELLAVRDEQANLTQIVARRIFTAIEDGTFASGTILPNEQVLAADLGVSRTALREAITWLASKGMLEARRRRGTMVLDREHWNQLDPDLIGWSPYGRSDSAARDLWRVVAALLPEAAATAARRRAGGHLDAIVPRGQALPSLTARARLMVELAALGQNRFVHSVVGRSMAALTLHHPTQLDAATAGITAEWCGILDRLLRQGAEIEASAHVAEAMTHSEMAAV